MTSRRRHIVWAARELFRTAPLAAARSELLYAGWLADGNMGDVATLTAHRRAFPGLRLMPLTTARLVPTLARVGSARADAVLVGGGNLVGWPLFRATATRMRTAVPDGRPLLTLGAGVEDPDFAPHSPSLAEALGVDRRDAGSALRLELARWAPLFAHGPRVAVRGERSRALLEEAGIAAVVTGEPALQLASELPAADVHDRLLGVNVGAPDGLWGSDPARVLETVAAACNAMRRRGWRIRLVPTWSGDLSAIRALGLTLGDDVELVEEFGHLDRLLRAVGECHAFVGLRLHSVVLASAASVPTLALEYHPKCLEFQTLIGRGDWVLRTDVVTPRAMIEALDALSDRDAHASAVTRGVAAANQRLAARARELRALLAGW